MKFLLFTLLSFLTLSAVSQNEIVLRFDHMAGDQPLELNTEYAVPDQGYNVNITRLQYYISQIEITHDGGQTTLLEETWLLVDASEQSDFELGEHSINSIEAISFWVGIEKDYNHLDPTGYPSGHPLAPQNPAMHWGWAAGYRYVCLEGKTGFNMILTYQIHALGDANYHAVSFETGGFMEDDKLVIPLLADYLGMYKNIDVSAGLIEHSEFNEAAIMLSNFSTEVYSPMYFTNLEENTFEGSLAVGPNPSNSGISRLMLSLPAGNRYSVTVSDMNGRLIKTEELEHGNHSLKIEPGQPGVYFVSLSQNGAMVQTEKLIITR